MYRPRKNYFKDYMWQNSGNWAYYDPGLAAYVAGTVALADPGVGLAYDLRQIWRDVRWAIASPTSPWHDAPLLASTKFCSRFNHEYTISPTLAPPFSKNGLFCISGMEGTITSMADTSGHYRQAGGAAALGFEGQYGKAYAVNYTGTIYEAAFAYHTGFAQVAEGAYSFVEPEDVPGYDPNLPAFQFAPLAFSIYCSRDVPITTSDGIHIIFVPKGTILNIYNSLGVLVPVTGGITGKIVVAIGDISQPNVGGAPPFLEYVTEFGAYDDTTPLDVSRDTEYFLRVIYYPESKPIKRFNVQNPNDPNLDRRLLIYLSTDKIRYRYVGKKALVDYNYTDPEKYMFLTTFNEFYDEQATAPFFPTLHQWDEVVCGSEWLPYEVGEVFSSHTQFPSYAKLGYTKESNETNYDTTSLTDNVVTWQQKELIEIWSVCQNWGIRNLLLAGYDFYQAFPDIWTVTNTTGTWDNEQTPWVAFEDTFDEEYADKANDVNWMTVGVNTWDTITTPGSLHGAGAGGIISLVTPIDLRRDYTIEQSLDFTGGGTVSQYFGTTGGGVVDSTVLVEFTDAPLVQIRERVGGAWVIRDNIAVDPQGEHTWKFVRIGAYFKLYMDGSLILAVALAVTVHTQPEYYMDIAGFTVIDMGYISVGIVFPDSYGYMNNVPVTTATQGSIHYHQAVNGIMGYCDMTFWEDFESCTGTTGEMFVRLHYDNGGAGTNYLGVRVAWDGAVKSLTLYSAAGTPYTVSLPSDPDIVNGYTHHSYKLYWSATGGFITQLGLYDARDGSLLYLVDGLALAYAANMMVEAYTTTQDGTESPYLGQIVMWESPEPTNDLIEVPVFDGQCRMITPADDKGYYEVVFMGMDYPLYLMSEYDSDSGHHNPESHVTFDALLTQYLTENGLPYWVWLHYWNFDISEVPLGWLPNRMRGFNVHGIFEKLAQWSGMRFCPTPEMQFLFQKYYRNFDVDDGSGVEDPLELGNASPQGIYWSSSTVLNYNLTQRNWLTGFVRVDDSLIGRRISSVFTEGADFIDPLANTAGLNQQIYDSIGAAHANPTMTARPPVTAAGNLVINDGGNARDMLNPTLGSVNTQTDAQTTTWLQQQADAHISTYSHKNELFMATMYASCQWYRPMDVIHIEVDTLDPALHALDALTILRPYRYVVHSARHIMHADMVQYIVGRREDYTEQEVEKNTVDGYGDVTSPKDKLINLAETARDANSNTCQ